MLAIKKHVCTNVHILDKSDATKARRYIQAQSVFDVIGDIFIIYNKRALE